MKVDLDRIIGLAQFRIHVAKVLDDVQAGHTYVITRNSQPVALVVPVSEHEKLTTSSPGPEPIELE